MSSISAPKFSLFIPNTGEDCLMTLIFNALSPLKVMDKDREECTIPKACPQIPQEHRVTLQCFLFFFFFFSYSKGCTRIVGYQRQQWWEIPTLSEAQVMSQSKIFQIPGHKTVVLFVLHSTQLWVQLYIRMKICWIWLKARKNLKEYSSGKLY